MVALCKQGAEPCFRQKQQLLPHWSVTISHVASNVTFDFDPRPLCFAILSSPFKSPVGIAGVHCNSRFWHCPSAEISLIAVSGLLTQGKEMVYCTVSVSRGAGPETRRLVFFKGVLKLYSAFLDKGKSLYLHLVLCYQ